MYHLKAWPYFISTGAKSPLPGKDSVTREFEFWTGVRGIHQLTSAGG